MEEEVKTIYIGGLNAECTESLLESVFQQYGVILNCKIVNETATNRDKFAFVEYDNRKSAELAMLAMNGRCILQKTIRVHWASGPKSEGDTTPGRVNPKHFTIFVGDIATGVTEADLLREFSKFGEISTCRITKDQLTSKSKNYGFISFSTKEAAENAISMMNGYWIGSRSIRTNWALKNAQTPGAENSEVTEKPKLTFAEVANLTSPNNTTVFCGNVTGINDTLLTNRFSRFGLIQGVRAFPDRKYGFVCFANKNAATRAIMELDGTDWNGETIKVSWGKEQAAWGAPGQQSFPFAQQQEQQTPPQLELYADYWRQYQAYQQQACAYANQQQGYLFNQTGMQGNVNLQVMQEAHQFAATILESAHHRAGHGNVENSNRGNFNYNAMNYR